jgi:hypothetical protein
LRIEDDAARKDAIWTFVRELRKVAIVLSDEGWRVGPGLTRISHRK